MTKRGVPPVVAQKWEFVHNVGNFRFSMGNSWRKSREDRTFSLAQRGIRFRCSWENANITNIGVSSAIHRYNRYK